MSDQSELDAANKLVADLYRQLADGSKRIRELKIAIARASSVAVTLAMAIASKRSNAFLLLMFLLPTAAMAEPPKAFARRLAESGTLFHDQTSNRRENVFYSSSAAFPRIQARAAWMRSPGHRANLPMIGLRVHRGPTGVYVVGRK